jgi:hypothetical protein
MSNANQEGRFFNLSASLLIMTALAKVYSATGSAKVFLVQDALLRVGYRPLMLFAAVVEIIGAVFLLVNQNDLRRALVLLWLSCNFLLYRLGTHLLGVHLCPCLGNFSDRIPLPPDFINLILQFIVLYWFLTSLNVIWRSWGAAKVERIILAMVRILTRKGIRTT